MILSTGAVRAVTITGTVWLLLMIVVRFILPDHHAFIVAMVWGAIFAILPIVNHVVIFIAIRRHNNQVADAVSGQNLSVLFRREKKAAIDMFTVIAVLMLCLAPAIAVNMFQSLIPDEFEFLYVWSTALIYINSSINPVIYLVRNYEIRNAVRSMMCS